MARGVTGESPRLRVRAAVAAIVLGLVAVSMSTPNAAASPARTGPAGSGIKWVKCKGKPRDDQLQCATVSVPLDWDRPNGKQIELAVIRRLASRPNRRIGSMFVIPGGPGLSGYDLVAGSGAELDKFGDGRFDVVGWDPRGTNRSSPVECFTNEAAQARFWAGVSIPSTPAESDAYQRKTVELARRCGEVSGELLSHITTADTARDLDALRQGVGDAQLTYVGLSYGTMIGQIYANLFPGRVRAMVLDGLVDAVDTTTSAEARTVNNVSSADEVFAQLIALCQSAAPGRCALAGHGETVAQRVTRLFATARQTPIPAPNAQPPGPLSYQDLLNSTFTPLRLPVDWPQFATDLEAAVNGDAVEPRDSGADVGDTGLLRRRDDVGGDLVRRRSRQPAVHRLATGDPSLQRRRPLVGSVDGMVAVGTVRLELAGPQHRPVHGAVERHDQDPDSAAQQPARPRHQLPQRPGRRATPRRRRAAHRGRLRPPDRQ